MFLLCLFAILFSVQCAPHNENSNLNEVVSSQYENLLDKVNIYAKYASNFQDVIGEHGRFRRSTDDEDETDKPIPIVVSKGFSEDFRKGIMAKIEAENRVEFEEIELNQVYTVESPLVVIISETKIPLKECYSIRGELGTGNADRFIVTIFVNEKCIIERERSSNTTEASKVQTRPTMIIYD